MKTLISIATLSVLWSFASPSAANSVVTPKVFVGGLVQNPGAFDIKQTGESLANLLNRAGGLFATKDEFNGYYVGSPIDDLKIRLYRGGKEMVFPVDPGSRELWSFYIQTTDTVEVFRSSPFKFGIFSMKLKLIQPEEEEKE